MVSILFLGKSSPCAPLEWNHCGFLLCLIWIFLIWAKYSYDYLDFQCNDLICFKIVPYCLFRKIPIIFLFKISCLRLKFIVHNVVENILNTTVTTPWSIEIHVPLCILILLREYQFCLIMQGKGESMINAWPMPLMIGCQRWRSKSQVATTTSSCWD